VRTMCAMVLGLLVKGTCLFAFAVVPPLLPAWDGQLARPSRFGIENRRQTRGLVRCRRPRSNTRWAPQATPKGTP
jgi:hypothetical protein